MRTLLPVLPPVEDNVIKLETASRNVKTATARVIEAERANARRPWILFSLFELAVIALLIGWVATVERRQDLAPTVAAAASGIPRAGAAVESQAVRHIAGPAPSR